MLAAAWPGSNPKPVRDVLALISIAASLRSMALSIRRYGSFPTHGSSTEVHLQVSLKSTIGPWLGDSLVMGHLFYLEAPFFVKQRTGKPSVKSQSEAGSGIAAMFTATRAI